MSEQAPDRRDEAAGEDDGCHTCAGEPWCAQVEAVTGWWEHGGSYQEQVCPQWRATKTEGDG